jgi:methylenetetrahydrofolate reductase (NADPH)
MEFKPPFIDVTTSREEYIFLERGNGLMERKITRMRPWNFRDLFGNSE